MIMIDRLSGMGCARSLFGEPAVWRSLVRSTAYGRAGRAVGTKCNVLIHQEHPDARSIEVGDSLPATLDARLRALLGRTKGAAGPDESAL
jgi:hypothetical protein